MTSLMWGQVSKAYASPSTMAVRSALARQSRVLPIRLRFASSSASPALDASPTAHSVDTPTVHALNSENPQFISLKGSISHPTLKAITVKPFKLTHMSPVQAEILPLLPDLASPYDPDLHSAPSAPARDLLVRAKTGTGKTMAFLVPAIEMRLKALEAFGKQAVLDAGLVSDKVTENRARRQFARERVGTLILSPTRELATQIASEAMRLTHHHEGFEVRLFTGGTSKRMQMRDWIRGRRDIVVATPGRLRDVLHSEPEVARGLAHTQLLVLDEADTLLDFGFRDDIEDIKSFLPPTPQRQTFLFSATVSHAIRQVARSTMAANHTFINCISDTASPVHLQIDQYHTVLPSAEHQISHTMRLIAHDQLTNPGQSKVIVFFPTTKMTQLFSTLMRELCKTTLPAGKSTTVYEIHSKRTQESRTRVSDSFRRDNSGASILVTSDVSARGVDYPGVSRVIQVGIPAGTEQYIHRVGRTGRAGTKGRGDLVLLPWEVGFVSWQLTQVPLKPLTLNELIKQTKELAAKFDEDPRAFFGPQDDRRSTRITANQFSRSVSTVVEDIDRNVRDLLPQLDEEAIKETFVSLLGFYIAKSPELRVQKDVIVEGCKTWSMEACGLSSPPYVSHAFLQRLGYSEGRTKNFGRNSRSDTYSSRNAGQNSWLARGNARSTQRGQSARCGAAKDVDLESSDSSPDEYRSHRYGRAPRESEDGGDRDYGSRRSYGGGGGGYGSGGGERERGRGYGSRDGGRGGYEGGRSGYSRGGGESYGGGMRDAGEAGYGFRRS